MQIDERQYRKALKIYQKLQKYEPHHGAFRKSIHQKSAHVYELLSEPEKAKMELQHANNISISR